MKIGLVGYGIMGKTIEAIALQRAHTVNLKIDIETLVDFTNANRALIQAQTDKAQAEYRFVFQKIYIDYSLGTLKPEDLD